MDLVQLIWVRTKQISSPIIIVLADCANAPMKQSLRDLNIAFARADVEAILAYFSDDIRWQIVGEADLRGTEAVRAALEAMQGVVVRELTIHSIITDGREGAINGLITTEQGSIVAFCDVCRFTPGQKIDLMKSYTVEINKEG